MATERKRNRERRSISSARPRNYSDFYKNDQSGATQPVAPGSNNPTPVASMTARGSNTVDWTKDYGYVAHDLRKLLLVSGVLFALILIASFFI